MPPGFTQRPELLPVEAHWYYILDGFQTLSNSRPLHVGAVGFIPLTEIESYCRMFQVSDVEFFVQIVRELDRVYVAQQNAKLAQRK